MAFVLVMLAVAKSGDLTTRQGKGVLIKFWTELKPDKGRVNSAVREITSGIGFIGRRGKMQFEQLSRRMAKIFSILSPPQNLAVGDDTGRAQAEYLELVVRAAERKIPGFDQASLEIQELIVDEAVDQILMATRRRTWPLPAEVSDVFEEAASRVMAKVAKARPKIEGPPPEEDEPPAFVGPNFWSWYLRERQETVAEYGEQSLALGYLDAIAQRRRNVEAGKDPTYGVEAAGGPEHHERSWTADRKVA